VTRVTGVLARAVAAALVVASLAVLGGAPVAPGGGPAVLAACATVPSLKAAVAEGDVVFVGTVLHLDNQDRWATVRVEERWSGARDLPETVVVHGGPDPGTATGQDRTYLKDRYLFDATGGPEVLQDDACSATTRWTDDLAASRPAGVTPDPDVVNDVRVSEFELDTFLPIVALAGALVVAVVAYLGVLRGRQRPPDWRR
jgi:hypothetical protein